jgi:hypothetical protein
MQGEVDVCLSQPFPSRRLRVMPREPYNLPFENIQPSPNVNEFPLQPLLFVAYFSGRQEWPSLLINFFSLRDDTLCEARLASINLLFCDLDKRRANQQFRP